VRTGVDPGKRARTESTSVADPSHFKWFGVEFVPFSSYPSEPHSVGLLRRRADRSHRGRARAFRSVPVGLSEICARERER
jgi:hypothetical protein